MDERTDVVETVTRSFRATDHHRWQDLEAVFHDPVTIDYTATRGGDPVVLSPAEVVAGWRPLFVALDAHQHMVANHLVTLNGENTSVTASFIATHQWRGETWTLGGDYAFECRYADTWRVMAMTMLPTWQTGAGDLLDRALAAVG